MSQVRIRMRSDQGLHVNLEEVWLSERLEGGDLTGASGLTLSQAGLPEVEAHC